MRLVAFRKRLNKSKHRGEASAYPFIRIADRYIGSRSLEVQGTIQYIAYKKIHR